MSRRGLRRPRGLKSETINPIRCRTERRGLRRPRGLKFTELRKALIDNRRGLRRSSGLKSGSQSGSVPAELPVEVCEDLVD